MLNFIGKSRGVALALLFLMVPVCLIGETLLSGSGGSFPAPVYAMWLKAYQKVHPDAKID